MTPEQFTIWLDGFLANKQKSLDEKETAILAGKLAEVFHKVTPKVENAIPISTNLKDKFKSPPEREEEFQKQYREIMRKANEGKSEEEIVYC